MPEDEEWENVRYEYEAERIFEGFRKEYGLVASSFKTQKELEDFLKKIIPTHKKLRNLGERGRSELIEAGKKWWTQETGVEIPKEVEEEIEVEEEVKPKRRKEKEIVIEVPEAKKEIEEKPKPISTRIRETLNTINLTVKNQIKRIPTLVSSVMKGLYDRIKRISKRVSKK
ncbi:MAG: hypothetical protein QXG39_04125 [Candidatus Aenigmatarchaeota archaeon]